MSETIPATCCLVLSRNLLVGRTIPKPRKKSLDQDWNRGYTQSICPRLCDRCLAQKGKRCPDLLNYNNMGTSAAWPLTNINHVMYLQRDAGSLSPWLAVDGWSLETVSFDFLHVVYLGTGRDVFASGVKTLISCGVFSHLPDQRLDSILSYVHREMQDTCAKAGFL